MAKAALAAELLAQHERELLDHASGVELNHSLFAAVTSKLNRSHQQAFAACAERADDPEPERFLEYAVPTAIAKSDLASRALCVDVYTSDNLKVEVTPEKRKAKRKAAEQAKKDYQKSRAFAQRHGTDGATPLRRMSIKAHEKLAIVKRQFDEDRVADAADVISVA